MDATDTAEPDEFARLLAQLSGTPTAPVAVPPTPVAPAFGATAPFPPLAVESALESAASPAASPAVVPHPIVFPPGPAVFAAPVAAAPVARAPELMGADELAAPPRPFPPPAEDAPALVAPPAFDPPSSPPSTPPVLPAAVVPPVAAPAAAAPSGAPAPSVTPPGSAPPAQAAPAASPAPAAPPSAPAARAPLDFATLLATPVDADASSRSAAPLIFGSGPTGDDEPDIARSTLGERIGLVLAILIAPLGLIVGIVAAAGSVRRRGWVVGIVKATIAIGAVLTVVIAIGGYFGYTQLRQQQEHDQTAAASTAFCTALKADPSMYQLPTFGWPAVAASIPDSLTAMQAYEDRWTKLAKVSPAGIKPDVTKVAAAAKKIIDSVTVARTVNDASNVAVMSSVASASGVPGWRSEYCG